MNSLRKIMTFVVVIALMAVLSVAVSAATVTIGTVEAEPGQTGVVVPVTYTDNPGTNGMQLNFTWNEKLTPTAFTQGTEALTQVDFNGNTTTGIAMWETDAYENYTENGELVLLTFTVPETEGEYEISADLEDCWDMDWGYIDVTIVPGKIIVKGSEPAATLTAGSQNLVLDGGINAKVYFNYDGTETVTINDKTALKDENGYYIAISVAPKDYATQVTYNAVAGDLNASYSVSVADIFDQYQTEFADDTKLMALVNALEVYCAQAAKYFPNGGTTDTVSADITNIAAPSIAGAVDGITLNSTSLILKDKVTLRHYFNVAEADIANYTVNNATLVKLDETHAYVEYANINVTELADVITTTINGALTIEFAPLAYASINEDANVANLVNALYNYYVAAVAYAG